MLCPDCGSSLVAAAWLGDAAWRCGGCGARAVPLAALERGAQPRFYAALECRIGDEAAAAGVRTGACPACRVAMLRVELPLHALVVQLDVCRACRLAWFDAREVEQVPVRPRLVRDEAALAQARRELAIARVRAQGELAAAQASYLDLPWPQRIAAWLGLPVEHRGAEAGAAPVTWTLAGLLVVVWLVSLTGREFAPEALGFVPSRPWRLLGATWLTHFFLHAGPWHLLGNVWFLLVFGDDVERRLGRFASVGLLLAATLAGTLLPFLLDPRRDATFIGASGGIFGLVGAYVVCWPARRFTLMAPAWWRWIGLARWMRGDARLVDVIFWTLPAWGMFALLIAWQLVLGLLQTGGLGEVSALSHLGGAAVGIGLGLVHRRGATPAEVPAQLPRAVATNERARRR